MCREEAKPEGEETSILTRVVTNEFPKSVLPTLSESERDKMMSEVLERSGLKAANEDVGDSLIARRCHLILWKTPER